MLDRCRTAHGPSAVLCLPAVILAQFLASYRPIEGHLNLHTYLIAAQVGAVLQNVSFHYKDGRTLFHSANDFRISAATFRAREAEKLVRFNFLRNAAFSAECRAPNGISCGRLKHELPTRDQLHHSARIRDLASAVHPFWRNQIGPDRTSLAGQLASGAVQNSNGAPRSRAESSMGLWASPERGGDGIGIGWNS